MAANGDDGFAARLRGFGPVGLLAILIVLAGNLVVAPLSAVLVLIWHAFLTRGGVRSDTCDPKVGPAA